MRRSTSSTSTSSWTGYEWNVPLDELIDCTKCPRSCQRCYGYGKARPKWQKAMIFCIYLALIDIALALLFRYSIYSATYFYLGFKDQRMIQRGDDDYNLSPVLCSDYQLQVVNGDSLFNAYVFSGAPTLSTDLSEYHLTRETSLPAGDTFITYHYLGNSAAVTFFVCAPDRSIYMYAVKDTSYIGYWESHKCCGHYSDHFVFRKCNKDGSSPDYRRYSSENGFLGDVFFVFMNDPYMIIPTTLKSLNLTSVLERYDYELADLHPTDSCEGAGDCSLNLNKEAKSVVIESLSPFTNTYAKVQGTCVASFWRYILYFAIIPLGVVFSFVLIGAILCSLQIQVNRLAAEGDRSRSMANIRGAGSNSSHTRTRTSRAPSSSLTSPLVRNEIYQSYEGSRDLPPSYDSVAVVTISDTVEREEPPPTYSSVTGNGDVV